MNMQCDFCEHDMYVGEGASTLELGEVALDEKDDEPYIEIGNNYYSLCDDCTARIMALIDSIRNGTRGEEE